MRTFVVMPVVDFLGLASLRGRSTFSKAPSAGPPFSFSNGILLAIGENGRPNDDLADAVTERCIMREKSV